MAVAAAVATGDSRCSWVCLFFYSIILTNLGNQGSDNNSPSDSESDDDMNAGAEKVDEVDVNGSWQKAGAENEDINASEN